MGMAAHHSRHDYFILTVENFVRVNVIRHSCGENAADPVIVKKHVAMLENLLFRVHRNERAVL